MTLFDSYLFVDWSARGSPSPVRESPDAIWIAEASSMQGEPVPRYLQTRALAADLVTARLRSLAKEGHRVLVGFDFPYSYPAGLAWAIGDAASLGSWSTIWRSLRDHFDFTADLINRHNVQQIATWMNSRCRRTGPGPAWFCTKRHENSWLRTTKAGIDFPFTTDIGMNLEEFRIAEQAAKRMNLNIRSVWQLGGRGSVGSQAITGIAYLSKIRADPALGACSRVWPFETGFQPPDADMPGPVIIHVEIWPSLVPPQERRYQYPVRDARQVCDLAAWIAGLDREDELAQLFERPTWLSEREADLCVREEGWILGVR
ncbi:MAG: hypothetical protein HY682_10610 [Chloroflexi bacterium]|nr:hypothetical protein [Chloroflexota bacterium]